MFNDYAFWGFAQEEINKNTYADVMEYDVLSEEYTREEFIDRYKDLVGYSYAATFYDEVSGLI